MGNIQSVMTNLLSDLLVNLSAGFLGASIIIPIQIQKTGKISLIVLIMNTTISCVLFASAVILNL